MRQQILLLTCLCSVAVIITAVPLPANDQELDMLQIPLTDGKEIDVLTLGDKDQEQLIADRNKRTVGLLRELFPDITKQVDSQINRVVNTVLKQVGPAILGTALNPTLTQEVKNPQQEEVVNYGKTDVDTIFVPDEEFALNRNATGYAAKSLNSNLNLNKNRINN